MSTRTLSLTVDTVPLPALSDLIDHAVTREELAHYFGEAAEDVRAAGWLADTRLFVVWREGHTTTLPARRERISAAVAPLVLQDLEPLPAAP